MCAKGSEAKMRSPTNARSGKYWVSYVPDIVLTTAVIVLTGGGSYLIRQSEYLGGLHGTGVGQSFLLALGLKPLLILITLVAVILAVTRLLLVPHTFRRMLLRLTFPLVCLCVLLIPVRLPGPGAAMYLQGFGQRMLKRVDVDAIQQWLTTEGAEHAGREYRHDFAPDLPACLVDFHPWLISFSDATPEHGVTVEFRWYARHGESYGLVVGPRSMAIPEEGMIDLPNGLHELRRPIAPGAYVFSRG